MGDRQGPTVQPLIVLALEKANPYFLPRFGTALAPRDTRGLPPGPFVGLAPGGVNRFDVFLASPWYGFFAGGLLPSGFEPEDLPNFLSLGRPADFFFPPKSSLP